MSHLLVSAPPFRCLVHDSPESEPKARDRVRGPVVALGRRPRRVPQSGRSSSPELRGAPFFLRKVALPCQRNAVRLPGLRLEGVSAMVTDEALNTLLDRLAALERREDQLAILRTWIAGLIRASNAERIDEQREVLGKLGGG